jgi:hypothetical protein
VCHAAKASTGPRPGGARLPVLVVVVVAASPVAPAGASCGRANERLRSVQHIYAALVKPQPLLACESLVLVEARGSLPGRQWMRAWDRTGAVEQGLFGCTNCSSGCRHTHKQGRAGLTRIAVAIPIACEGARYAGQPRRIRASFWKSRKLGALP